MDDDSIMRRVQAGSHDAFEQLVRRWETPMLNYFFRNTGDVDAAEELRQELFVRLYRRCDGWRGKGSFRAWMYAIAANLVHDHRKRSARIVAVGDIEVDPEKDVSPVARPAARADEVVQQKQSADCVRDMLAALAPEESEALVLRFYEQLKYREISEALGIAESGAKSRVYRAVERLREMMTARGLTAEDFL